MRLSNFSLTVGYLLAAVHAAPAAQHDIAERQHKFVPRQHVVVQRQHDTAKRQRVVNKRQHGVIRGQYDVVRRQQSAERDRPTYLGNGVYTDPNTGNDIPQPAPAPIPCPTCPPQTPCPTCPQPTPVVPCIANQSVVNPGFEANGGTLQPWTVSDPMVVLLDSQNGLPDSQGLHSAQFILNAVQIQGWIAQNVTICPNQAYRIYFAVKLLAQIPAAAAPTLPANQGQFADVSQCNIFASLSAGGGSSLTTGGSLQYNQYNTITTMNSFTTGNSTSANIMISVVCSTDAFGTTAATTTTNPDGTTTTTPGQNVNGYLYFDNIVLVPQNNNQ